MLKIFSVFSVLFISLTSVAQANSAEILLQLKKLKHPGSVLYIAAHPDDENTRLIAYLAKGQLIRTGYLSLTRGDGGQNLIGTEKGEYLGLLRTQELLEARKLDGGQQFFTRAVDFGYSKTADETLEKWDKNAVLEDMVWVIRNFKPEILITRFPTDNYAGHGHHSASAILAEIAFDSAASPTFAKHQLSEVAIWQPKSLYFNTSSWWDKTIPEQAKNNPDFLSFDIGTYNAELGMWHNEIASLSRSKHKSQGFGTISARGTQTEYLKYVKGQKRTESLLQAQDISWKNIPSGEKVERLIDDIISTYNPQMPENSVEKLLKLRQQIEAITFPQKQFKLDEVNRIIINSLGLYCEALSEVEFTSSQTDKNRIELQIINPSKIEVELNKVKNNFSDDWVSIDKKVVNNETISHQFQFSSTQLEPSQPYWLVSHFNNMFHVKDFTNIGLPENNPFLYYTLQLKVLGETIAVDIPVEYKWSDRAKGELRVDFKNYPSVMLTPKQQSLIFTESEWKTINVNIKSLLVNQKINVKVNVPQGWEIDRNLIPMQFSSFAEEQTLNFKIKPTQSAGEAQISFAAIDESGQTYTQGLQTINYDHITKQVLFPSAVVKLVKLDLNHSLKKVGYLMGAGDEVAQLLHDIGIEVIQLTPDEINTQDLSVFDAIVGGIRVYNTQPEMAFCKTALLKYIEQGGTYLVQYNTAGSAVKDIGPYDFNISRKRVTKEEAEAKILLPQHPIFNSPNKITSADFDGWVQERGLYFADEWNQQYLPLIAWNDPGEDPQEGGLLVANYGKGAFIYTGISFFRQLPKGVPGAYRLLINLLSYQADAQ